MRSGELAIYEVQRLLSQVRRYGCHAALSSPDTFDPELAHQTLHCTPGHRYRLSVELFPDLVDAVHAVIDVPNTLNILGKMLVPFSSIASVLRVLFLIFMAMVGGRCNRQYFANRLDTIVRPVLIDKRH